MKKRSWPILFLSIVLALASLGILLNSISAQGSGSIQGMVQDASGPVIAARVRVRATDIYTHTDSNGQFTLTGLEPGQGLDISSWADGYYIASRFVTPTVSGITLTLRRYHTVDHPEYQWTSPISSTSEGACGNCHPMIYPQWVENAHGGAVSNPRFFSLYNGTDLSGTTQVGAGYQLDYPGTAGNCASCHAPGAGVDGYLTTDMNTVRGVITAGIHCDYCHKVGGIYLNPATGSVYPNAPGAESQRMLRPPAGDNIFFGPYDDIPDPDTYLPAIAESRFCAPCHQFSFWGTPVYASYGEWLHSPYAAQGITCQDCHMPPNGDSYFASPEAGGREHPPETIPSHLQPGATSETLLQETVDLAVNTKLMAGEIQVNVAITNTGAGHHVPTDHPGRHMILTVRAEGSGGQALGYRGGPLVPAWGGVQAGSPGKAFAKLLRDIASGESPVVSYWKQTVIASDNRIPAQGVDRSEYRFSPLPSGGPVTVTVELRLRRAYQALMDGKDWQMPDILMETSTAPLVTLPGWEILLPLTIHR